MSAMVVSPAAVRRAILRDIDALSKITVRTDVEAMGVFQTYASIIRACRMYLEAEEEAEGRAAVRAIAKGST